MCFRSFCGQLVMLYSGRDSARRQRLMARIPDLRRRRHCAWARGRPRRSFDRHTCSLRDSRDLGGALRSSTVVVLLIGFSNTLAIICKHWPFSSALELPRPRALWRLIVSLGCCWQLFFYGTYRSNKDKIITDGFDHGAWFGPAPLWMAFVFSWHSYWSLLMDERDNAVPTPKFASEFIGL